MTPPRNACHACAAPLPPREFDPADTARTCEACAGLTDREARAVEESDRRRARAWTEAELLRVRDAARALLHKVPPADRYRAEWLALLDALDRTSSTPTAAQIAGRQFAAEARARRRAA